MRITTKAVYDIETGRLIFWSGYEYTGLVALACSSGGQVATNDQALQNSEIAANKTYLQDYNTSFANQETVLAQQKARLDQEISNPMGYSPAELHSATTSINENTATAAKQAIGAAAAAGARYGSSDIGGGGTAARVGEIASAATGEKARELSSLSQQNEQLKQQRLQAGLAGLQNVASEYGGASSGATAGAGSTASGAVGAGSGVLAAKQAGWDELAGTLGAIGGVAKSFISPIKI
jgi:hypothetical protein